MPAEPVNRPEVISILQDCKETPEDDTPRLILADWLEEHRDQPRAELIRVQCAQARISPRSAQSLHRERARELLRRHHRQWERPLSKLGPVNFQRGLLQISPHPYAYRQFGVRAEQWPDEYWAWVEWARPGIHIDRWQGITGDTWWFLRRVTGLDLSGSNLRAEHVETIVRLPQLANLLDLNLAGNEVSLEAARALVESPHLTRLLRLQVPSTLSAQVQGLLRQRFGAGLSFG